MNFIKEEEDDIKRLFKKSAKDPLLELECIIGNLKKDINTKDHFINVLKRLKGKFTRMTSNNVLNISFPTDDNQYGAITKHISRVGINGNGLISHYAKTNKLNAILEQAIFENKSFNNQNRDRIVNDNFNIRFNLKKEEQLDYNSNHIVNLVKEWSKIGKFFRKKQTFTFYEEDNDFKIDISIISSNTKQVGYVKNISESGILENKNMSYELEVEYIGNKKPNIKDLFEGHYHKHNTIDKNEKEKEAHATREYQDSIFNKLKCWKHENFAFNIISKCSIFIFVYCFNS